MDILSLWSFVENFIKITFKYESFQYDFCKDFFSGFYTCILYRCRGSVYYTGAGADNAAGEKSQKYYKWMHW